MSPQGAKNRLALVWGRRVLTPFGGLFYLSSVADGP